MSIGILCYLVEPTSTKLWFFAGIAVALYIMIQTNVVKDKNFNLIGTGFGNQKVIWVSSAAFLFSFYMMWTTPWFFSKCIAIIIGMCIIMTFGDSISQGYCFHKSVGSLLSSGDIKYSVEEVNKIYSVLSKLEGNESSKAKHIHNIWKNYGV